MHSVITSHILSNKCTVHSSKESVTFDADIYVKRLLMTKGNGTDVNGIPKISNHICSLHGQVLSVLVYHSCVQGFIPSGDVIFSLTKM
jgi:hypothetical protein